jgi:hypothetical protein
VAVCPGFRVIGAAIPVAPKRVPATEIPEIITGTLPVDVKTTGAVAVLPIFTLP